MKGPLFLLVTNVAFDSDGGNRKSGEVNEFVGLPFLCLCNRTSLLTSADSLSKAPSRPRRKNMKAEVSL